MGKRGPQPGTKYVPPNCTICGQPARAPGQKGRAHVLTTCGPTPTLGMHPQSFALQLSAEQLAQILEVAAARQMSASAVIREALYLYLAMRSA